MGSATTAPSRITALFEYPWPFIIRNAPGHHEFCRMVNHMLSRLSLASLLFLRAATAQEITSPEKFFGFQLGADKKMARWDKIVEYYGVLEKTSRGRQEGGHHGPA